MLHCLLTWTVTPRRFGCEALGLVRYNLPTTNLNIWGDSFAWVPSCKSFRDRRKPVSEVQDTYFKLGNID